MNSITLNLTKPELNMFVVELTNVLDNVTERGRNLNRVIGASNSNIAEVRRKKTFLTKKLRQLRPVANANNGPYRVGFEGDALQFTEDELTEIIQDFNEILDEDIRNANNNNDRQYNDKFQDLIFKLQDMVNPPGPAVPRAASVASSVNSNNSENNSRNYAAGPEARRRRNRRSTRKNRKSRKNRKASRRS
jgi:hypothetical protein